MPPTGSNVIVTVIVTKSFPIEGGVPEKDLEAGVKVNHPGKGSPFAMAAVKAN
jgi:hypothetical protein